MRKSKKTDTINDHASYFKEKFEELLNEETPVGVEVDIPETTLPDDEPQVEAVSEPVNDEDEVKEMSLNDVLAKLKASYESLPLFGPSLFTLRKDFLQNTYTPARAYLAIGRLLFHYLEEYFYYRLEVIKSEQEVEVLREKALKTEQFSEKERHLIQANLDIAILRKTKNDLRFNEYIQVVSFLYNEFIKFPAFNRNEVEMQEHEFHIKTAINDTTPAHARIKDIDSIIYEMNELQTKIQEVMKQKMSSSV